MRNEKLAEVLPRVSRFQTFLLRAACALIVLFFVGYTGVSVFVATHLTVERVPPTGTPADVGLVYEPITFQSAEDHIRLEGWYLPASGTRAIVLVHGIDSNRWDTHGPWLPRLIPVFVAQGFDVVLFDLRAHGESGGKHSGLGLLEERDVQGAVSLVEQRGIAPGRIGLFGQSFGGSIALVSTAVIPDVAAVASDSAFADVSERLNSEISRRTILPPIFAPGILLVGSALYGIDLTQSPERAMPRVAPRPVLLIHGTADERIPVSNAYQLKAASSSPNVELWIVPGAIHTMSYLVDPETYTQKITTFFARALGPV